MALLPVSAKGKKCVEISALLVQVRLLGGRKRRVVT